MVESRPKFTPIRTERLLLRAPRPDDAAPLAVRRNHPDVAEYQDWTIPYPVEQAEQIVAGSVAMDGPRDSEWWMATIADERDTVVYGDLAVRLTWQGRAAEIGYTLARERRGNGFAVEAVAALVAYLFDDLGITRVEGTLHPDNVASAMVLERTGFLFEGHTRSSYWVGDVNSDTHIYGMTRADWEAWRDRPTTPVTGVRLFELDSENYSSVWDLKTHESQKRFVAPMPASFADALFSEVVDGHLVIPWFRGVEADGEVVGFVMVALSNEHFPEPFLWRLLVDRLQQRRGVGRKILDLIVADCRARGDTTLVTSWSEGKGSPRPFYESYGFVATGGIIDDETEARLTFG